MTLTCLPCVKSPYVNVVELTSVCNQFWALLHDLHPAGIWHLQDKEMTCDAKWKIRWLENITWLHGDKKFLFKYISNQPCNFLLILQNNLTIHNIHCFWWFSKDFPALSEDFWRFVKIYLKTRWMFLNIFWRFLKISDNKMISLHVRYRFYQFATTRYTKC